MNEELRALRHESYDAAGKYHLAHGEFFSALARQDGTAVAKAAIQARTAGTAYKSALERLINYLTTAGMALSNRDDIMRALQMIDALDRELKMLAVYRQEGETP